MSGGTGGAVTRKRYGDSSKLRAELYKKRPWVMTDEFYSQQLCIKLYWDCPKDFPFLVGWQDQRSGKTKEDCPFDWEKDKWSYGHWMGGWNASKEAGHNDGTQRIIVEEEPGNFEQTEVSSRFMELLNANNPVH